MILILSEPADPTVRLVLPKLLDRGADVLWWDPADFPARARLTAVVDGPDPRLLLHTGDAEHDLSAVTAVWNRRPGRPRAAAATDPEHRDRAESLARIHLAGFLDLLEARWLPARGRVLDAVHNKLTHLVPAVRHGFTVPETVFTNDPGALVPAWHRHGGRLVAKLLQPEECRVDGERHLVYTTEVGRRQLAGRHRVRHEPVILQPYVDKDVELRVTVVGDRVFAAAIDSQASRLTRVDWRHYEDESVPYTACELPADVAARCAAYVAACGLSYGALDLIRTPAGEHVFLEINPNGHWGWIEDETGLPIGDAIAGWLLAAEEDPT
ncbi:MvdC/MvdD family ATP grasp protein [Actinomadura parmotrematis]|uniref:ATP-dependent carboxylate-amine ligase n=1 Tax=Actinomadura parmotrematis TaxID=2864039 RepID=A0ABS7FNB5_9ACTN|nr:ATP-dependent carboxylate-amine ligase [Actinomadura parmotrematis]MBW8481873.1 ATP-dependent carboxylate-amine ligase [Actinomadura parmotrematis]